MSNLVWDTQGRRKQSPDGQAKLHLGGEAVNNLREARGKIWTLLAIFSSQEALSLHLIHNLSSNSSKFEIDKQNHIHEIQIAAIH